MTQYTQETKNMWFPAQKEPIYDPTDTKVLQEFKDYWKKEKDRCINGFYLADGQVHISGWLYSHTVYWKIAAYREKENGKRVRTIITPRLRDTDWIVDGDFTKCEQEGKFYPLVGARDWGKALKNTSKIYTASGHKEIGNATIGDRIYGADGKITTVTGVYPQGKIDLYRVVLSDGREVVCCDEHIWRVWNSVKRVYENLPLKDIRQDFKIDRRISYKNSKGVEYKYAIPNNSPVEYEKKHLPIDPYFLGLWLGDGDNRVIRITTADKQIEEYVNKIAVDEGLKCVPSGKYGFRITSGKMGGRRDKNPLLDKFIDLGVIKNKHIPSIYLNSNVRDRMELLRGLMDTDGAVSNNGAVEFCTTDIALAEGFYELARGLGIITTYKKSTSGYKKEGIYIQGKDRYRFRLLTSKDIFKLERKRAIHKQFSYRENKTSIADVHYYGKDEATCITVDNADKLFLTDNYTITHNSVIGASRAGWLYTFFDTSESVISGGADNYIKLATDKIEDGLTNIHPIWKKNRLSNDWKREIKAGWKDKKTNQIDPKSSNSKIIMRNYENGIKSMAANGTRPGFHLIDEIGTILHFIACLKDSDGCWWSSTDEVVEDSSVKPSCLVMIAGCVCAGTKVYTGEGKVINIEDLKKEDGIIGYNGKQAEEQKINYFKEPELKPCYRITTDNNTTIECSDDHPLLITKRKFYKKLNGKEYKRLIYQEAKELNINDQIIVPSEIGIFGKYEEKDARIIGLMIGDGNYSFGSTPTLSCSEQEIFNYVENYVSTINKEYQISENRFFGQLGLPSIKQKLISAGLYGQVKFNKRLPENIHLYNKNSLCEILGGYFDADGNVYYNNKKDVVRVVLTSVVFELLQQVKYQLLKLGIHCSIVKENRNSEPSEGYEGQQDYIYRLYINQQQDLQLFKDNIYLLVESKRNNLNYIKESKYKKFDGVFEINPLNNKEGFFNRGTGDSIIENLRYETIKNIEFIGEQEVFNLNCNNNHNYISNSFITRQTGGDMEVGAEAGEVFNNPDGYNMLSFENPETGGRMGRFIDALMSRMGYKEEKPLSEYLGISHPDLDAIKILVTNRERALKEWWEPAYAKALKSGNQKAVTKFLAYWPLKPSHCFLVVNSNPYNVEAAQKQQTKLKTIAQTMHDGVIGQRVEIFHDGEKIRHKHSEKYPITEFPVKSQNTDAPVMMWEPPISSSPPWGLYIAGVDPYRQDSAEYSESLGAVYIYKRMHEIASEKYQDMFVAAYVARPKTVDDWNEQARLLIKYYNAFTLCENDDMTFIRYMQNKGDDFYLADQPQWLKDVVPYSNVNRGKGIHRSSEKVRNFLRTCFKRYLDEKLGETKEDESIAEILGVSRVQDVMLLEEVCKFHKDGNFDREVAASLAVALADKMEPLGKVMASGSDPRYISYFSKKPNSNHLFTKSQNAFGPSKSNKRPSLF